MDEAQWLASDDPAAMLRHLTHGRVVSEGGSQTWGAPAADVSDRKLRLFACACCRQVWGRLDNSQRCQIVFAEQEPWHQASLGGVHPEAASQDAIAEYTRTAGDDRCVRFALLWLGSPDAVNVAAQAPAWLQRVADVPTQAALMRDIVGNPWQPATIGRGERCQPLYGSCALDETHSGQHNAHALRVEARHITPAVLALARAACDEWGEKCRQCAGEGKVPHSPKGPGGSAMWPVPCPACHGSGRTGDGRLDPQRLAVLSDALEEAGCHASEWCPPTERGGCGGLGRVYAPVDATAPGDPNYPGDRRGVLPCPLCGGGGRFSPLLSHLRSPGPHVRGCWALDLILGKE